MTVRWDETPEESKANDELEAAYRGGCFVTIVSMVVFFVTGLLVGQWWGGGSPAEQVGEITAQSAPVDPGFMVHWELKCRWERKEESSGNQTGG